MVDLLKIIRGYKDVPAFVVMDGEDSKTISYEQFYETICRCAYNLECTLGDIRGKHIGIYANSGYEYVMILAALLFERAIAVPLNTHESRDAISYEIDNSDMHAIVVDENLMQNIDILGRKTVKISELNTKEGKLADLQDYSEDEWDNPVAIVYTSGTTGMQKGVVVSAGNLFGEIREIFDSSFPFEKYVGARVYTNLPYYHIGGITEWLLQMGKGFTVYLSTNPGNVLSDLEHHMIDVAVVIPATLKLWKKAVKSGHMERLGNTKLIITGGAAADFTTVKSFLEQNIPYGQFYGMTEYTGIISSGFDCISHLESVGRPNPSVKVTIVDGEICLSGPGLMLGYYKNKEETDKVIEGDLLHTGDLGYIDEDGYMYITGRKKNLIILSNGENVSPEELENHLYKCEDIIECKVYEENDRICALIYAAAEKEDVVSDYIADLNTRLPIFKRIYKKTIQNEALEKTGSGKIKR